MHEHSHENRERTEAPLPDAHAVAALLDVHPNWVYAETRAGRLQDRVAVRGCGSVAQRRRRRLARAAGVIV